MNPRDVDAVIQSVRFELYRENIYGALETAKALVQAYGRSCRHEDDYGVTYILDGQFERFLAHYRALLPSWFLDAVYAAMRARHPEALTD